MFRFLINVKVSFALLRPARVRENSGMLECRRSRLSGAGRMGLKELLINLISILKTMATYGNLKIADIYLKDGLRF